MNNRVWSFLVPFFSVIIALLIAAVVIILIGQNPVIAYKAMIEGAFGNIQALADTVIKTTPLILTGLAVGFGFRAGLFNIGAEGQMIMGGILATVVGMHMRGIPPLLAIPLTMIAGMLGGAVWASIAGYLKAKREHTKLCQP